MKSNNFLVYIALATLIITGCKPHVRKHDELPAPSAADFSYYVYDDVKNPNNKNSYVFQNTTAGGYYSAWDFGGVKKSIKNKDTVFFAFAGVYKITLTSNTTGGISTVTKELNVPQTSPFAANFDIQKLDENHFRVSVSSLGATKALFKYDTGDSAYAMVDTAYYPFQGTYNIKLTTFTSYGPSTIVKQVTSGSDDLANPAINDVVFQNLTGGMNATSGKTWVMVGAPKSGGVGPLTTTTPDWWNYPDGFTGDAWTNGMLANEFTFKFRNYQYIPKSQVVTAHWAFANQYFNKSQAQYADTYLTDPNHKQAPFILKKGNPKVGIGYTLDFTNGSYLGYFDNRYHHEIIKLNADTLVIRHPYSDNPKDDPKLDGGARYFTFVVKK